MKKVALFVLVITVIMSLSISVQAETVVKEPTTKLEVSQVTAKVGETISLTASTVKKGSVYVDYWVGANPEKTIKDDVTERYISTAKFTAQEPGQYTITYRIEMQAGKSDVFFEGFASQIIEVVDEVTVAGIEIRDVVFTDVIGPDGTIVGCNILGNLCILWSNGTVDVYGTVCSYMGADETEKTVSGIVTVEGQQYPYTVVITR